MGSIIEGIGKNFDILQAYAYHHKEVIVTTIIWSLGAYWLVKEMLFDVMKNIILLADVIPLLPLETQVIVAVGIIYIQLKIFEILINLLSTLLFRKRDKKC